jgi:hypothetical protein
MTKTCILWRMPKFSIATLLLVFGLIPIGIGFALGSEMNLMVALVWLYPTELSGDEIVKWGWPTNAVELLKPYFGDSLLYPLSLTHKVGLVFVIGACAALGALRLHIAKLSAWMLIAMLPFSLAIWNYRTTGQVYTLSPDWVVTVLFGFLCVLAWCATRLGTQRWLYRNALGYLGTSSTQKVVFSALALVIVLTSISGWFWIQRMQDYILKTGGF